MKKNILVATLLAMSVGMGAQNIYKLADYSNNDLSGTARYVGLAE